MLQNGVAWQSLSESALRRQQIAKLRDYLKRVVVPFSPYYRKRFAELQLHPDQLRDWSDLARIPFSEKANLLATPTNPQRTRDFILAPEKKVLARRRRTILDALLHGRAAAAHALEREYRPIFMTATTGRSADPVSFVYTAHDLAVLGEVGYRVMRICAAERTWKMINMFPFAPHLAFWVCHYAGTEYGAFVLSTGGGKVMGTDGNLRAIGKLDPEVLIGMPTFVYHVLQQAVDEGMKCHRLRKIVLGGEKVPGGMRRKLRSLGRQLGVEEVDIHTTYGFTEAKMVFAECAHPPGEKSGGFHLYPDLGIIEIVDPKTGEQLPAGSPGEIVFTPLEARGSVVLRYRTGDCIDGGLFYEPCPHCGRRVPRLVGSISRSVEVKEMRLEKLKGTLIDFNQLEHILDDSENVGTWQLELRKMNDDPLEIDEVILHVQKTGDVDEELLKSQLMEEFVAKSELHPNQIIFENPRQMRKLQGVGRLLKEQRIVDRRPEAGAAPEEPSHG